MSCRRTVMGLGTNPYPPGHSISYWNTKRPNIKHVNLYLLNLLFFTRYGLVYSRLLPYVHTLMQIDGKIKLVKRQARITILHYTGYYLLGLLSLSHFSTMWLSLQEETNWSRYETGSNVNSPLQTTTRSSGQSFYTIFPKQISKKGSFPFPPIWALAWGTNILFEKNHFLKVFSIHTKNV